MATTKLTIEDIARLAGVSEATVSRVLNQKPDVAPATRERILRIMEENGFVPSITAAGLAGGRTRLIGALVPSLTWPLIPEIMRGIAEVVEQTAYELVLYSISHGKDRVSVIERILGAKLIEGLVAVFPDGGAKPGYSSDDHRVSLCLADLYEHGFPVVIIDDQSGPTSAPWVSTNNRVGAHAAVKHLIDLGHRRIAHIKGPASFQCSHDRYEGYSQALREAGLTPDPTLVVEGAFTPDTGHDCAVALLSLPERPTAVFAGNDDMAYGVLTAAEELGLRVPQDFALVGFDDATPAEHTRPSLTTARQPFFEMGQHATRILLSLVDTPRAAPPAPQGSSVPLRYFPTTVPGNQEPIRIQLPTNLIIRESSGAPLHQRDSA